jgi:predicted nuclease of predicted toxin-antitoxin system
MADVHISPITVNQLKKSGYNIVRVTEFLPPKTPDEEIIELARKRKSVIITQDLDFSALIAQSGESLPSVVSLRIGNVKPQIITELLRKIIPQIESELKAGAIISVDEYSFRIRKLPI